MGSGGEEERKAEMMGLVEGWDLFAYSLFGWVCRNLPACVVLLSFLLFLYLSFSFLSRAPFFS